MARSFCLGGQTGCKNNGALSKAKTLFGEIGGKFKPKGTFRNNGDFGGRQLRGGLEPLRTTC